MANPHGYTQISNEVLEALVQVNLYPYETRVLLFIIRKTYGWHKKSDLIPLSQIVSGTGIAKSNASRALSSLISKQIVIRLDNKQLGFNKDYDSWLQKLSAEITLEPEQENPVSEVIRTDNNSGGGELSTETPKLSAETPPSNSKKLSAETPQKKDSKETTQKKRRATLQQYQEELRQRFSDLDFDMELEKFNLYWNDGHRKLKNPKLALLNWMTRAREFRAQGGRQHGEVRANPGKLDGWKKYAGKSEASGGVSGEQGTGEGTTPMGD